MSDIDEGEFWCELAELLDQTTKGRDGIDAPLQISRRRALELVREQNDYIQWLQLELKRMKELNDDELPDWEVDP